MYNTDLQGILFDALDVEVGFGVAGRVRRLHPLGYASHFLCTKKN